jgi:hypothetical protein
MPLQNVFMEAQHNKEYDLGTKELNESFVKVTPTDRARRPGSG